MSGYADGHVPVIVRCEGAYVWDDSSKRYLDGLAGLFTVQVGHGRRELAEAAAHQAAQLAYFPPPPGYFARVREICDRYDVLMVSDEVICAFGRLGHMFGAQRYGYEPDIITCAKGLTSGYSPLGAMLVTDRVYEPFATGATTFMHGYTFGGHPVSCAVALANLDVMEKDGLLDHVQANEAAFRSTLERLHDLPIVGDVRGAGYFYGIEMVKDKTTKETFDEDESERLLRGFLSKALFDAGLYCRADDRGDPVVQLAPPLICDQQHFDEIEQILRNVLTDAWTHI
jgi:adenosylmethionine-8-amino-7-oxononanoate aminotransferase